MRFSFFGASKAKALPDALSWSGNIQQLEGVSQGLKDKVLAYRAQIRVLFVAFRQENQILAGMVIMRQLLDSNEQDKPVFPPKWLPKPIRYGQYLGCSKVLLDAALTLNLYAGVLRNQIGVASDRILAPEGATLIEQSHYVFPLLKHAFKLVNMAKMGGADVAYYKHIVINYLILGLINQQHTCEYVSSTLKQFEPLQEGLVVNSLVDLGYLQELLGNSYAAVDNWMKAGATVSIALIDEYYAGIENNNILAVEVYLAQALEKGSAQAGIRLVQMYLTGFERALQLPNAYRPEAYETEHYKWKLTRALDKVVELHAQKPGYFECRYQSLEGFREIYKPFLKNDVLKHLIEKAEKRREDLEDEFLLLNPEYCEHGDCNSMFTVIVFFLALACLLVSEDLKKNEGQLFGERVCL